MSKSAVLMIIMAGTFGCHTVRPYEKEFLLHPLMDDATIRRLDARLMVPAMQGVEKLGGGMGLGGSGTSCPTCGG